MSEPKFKFTKDMVNERFIKMLQEQPEQSSTPPPEPTLMKRMRAGSKLASLRKQK